MIWTTLYVTFSIKTKENSYVTFFRREPNSGCPVGNLYSLIPILTEQSRFPLVYNVHNVLSFIKVDKNQFETRRFLNLPVRTKIKFPDYFYWSLQQKISPRSVQQFQMMKHADGQKRLSHYALCSKNSQERSTENF